MQELPYSLQEPRSYDPFGQRRRADWADPAAAPSPIVEKMGVTGHEDDDELGLVKMRGRTYDPKLGRFLMTDPIVQAPLSGQSWNRYTYVFNNPRTRVDPSGYEGDIPPPAPIGISIGGGGGSGSGGSDDQSSRGDNVCRAPGIPIRWCDPVRLYIMLG
jgi:RHS repeat-associated protein